MKESHCQVNNAARGVSDMMYFMRRKKGAAGDNDAASHINVGSYYEIDSSALPQRTLEQLKSIRIVMVSKKTDDIVFLRFPSMDSLRSHFSSQNQRREESKILPALDEKHEMESGLAGEVLYRRVPPHKIAINRNSWSFWAFTAPNWFDVCKERISSPAFNTRLCGIVSKKGACWSELRSPGMVKWGKRRRVQYLNPHVKEKNNEGKEENDKVKEEDHENGKEETEEEGEEEEGEEEDGNKTEQSPDREENVKGDDWLRRSSERAKNFKRKRRGTCTHRSSSRRVRRTNSEKENQITVYKQNPEEVVKRFIDRWSVERYKLAEKNMLKVMKEKNAVFGNPILRPQLRAEARKWIGDTGLLDHLLKHMAGNVAPGGQERFMRRHNAEGAMEYWLESADLMDIRKEAGVQDPYWTPLPGWKLGDNTTQDPLCAREIKELKEELATLKRVMEKLTEKKQEEDLAIVTTPSSCVSSQNLDQDSSLVPVKEMYAELLKKKAQTEEQLMIISESLREMEEEMGKLEPIVEEPGPKQPNSTETPLLLMEPPERDRKEVDQNQDTELSPTTQQDSAKCKRLRTQPQPPPSREDKAAKKERQSSGFRICKPHGSFEWTNMAPTMFSPPPHYRAMVPTLTFASSPSQQPGHRRHHHIATPFKPLAERPSFIVPSPIPITTIPFPPTPPEISINLNEAPKDISHHTGFCSSQNWSHGNCSNMSSSSKTCQQRHYNHGEGARDDSTQGR